MAVALGLFVMPGAESAAVEIPSSVEPSRPQRNLEEPSIPRARPRFSVPMMREQTAPEASAEISFVFRELKIDGAKALTYEHLRRDWEYLPGDTITVQDVFSFANQVTRAYAREGYVLSFGFVPEQQIRDGVVTIGVVEGFVSDFEFTGDGLLEGGFNHRRMTDLAKHILSSKPLQTADVERYLLLINDLPGIEVEGMLSPSPSVYGGSVLHIDVKRQRRIEAQINASNFMTKSLGRRVLGGSLQLNGLGGVRLNGFTGGLEKARLDVQTSAFSDAYRQISGQVGGIIGSDGLRVNFSGSYSKSEPTDDFLRDLEYAGKSLRGGLSVEYPLIRRREQNLYLESSASFESLESDILDTELTRDRLRQVGISSTYEFADGIRGVSSVRLALERGLKVLNATGNSRSNGELEYNKVNLDIQRRQPLAVFYGGEVSTRLSLSGQVAVGPGGLFSSQECEYGGRRFGRAFDSGEMLGDHCALANLELHWLKRVDDDIVFDLYGFADGGMVRQKGALQPDELRRRTASSVGGGLRLQISDSISGLVEFSQQVKLPDDSQDQDKHSRMNLGITVSF